jgi:ABC-type transport system involved in multi-copper enzyme maturation permease subunit
MKTATSSQSFLPPLLHLPFPFQFLKHEYLYLLGSLRVKLVPGALIYSLLMVPFILKKPPQEILKIFSIWFGNQDADLKLFLVCWIDIVMNKILLIGSVILAGGLIADERSRGLLPVFLSKPVSHEGYFLGKVIAAALAYATLYAITNLLGLIYFPFVVKAFQADKFLCLAMVHMFAAMFGVMFCGTVAVFFKRKLSAMLAGFLLLNLFVGTAFLGFVNPKWMFISYFNPIFYGVFIITKVDNLTVPDVLGPMLMLILFCALTAAVGAFKAGHISER